MNKEKVKNSQELICNDIAAVVKKLPLLAKRLSGKTLLLTGASGFLPSYIVDTIAWLNDHVLTSPCSLILVVRSPVTPEGRLGHLLNRKDVFFIQQSVSIPLKLERHIDFIIHAASPASPKSYLANSIETMDVNVVGTRQLLDIARENNVESFLFFSSGEIYGEVDNKFVPTPETYFGNVDCTGPRACYTESKRYGETLCSVYWQEYKVPVKMVRPFHVYGPGMLLDDGRIIAALLKDRVNNQPIHLLSDGTGMRAFCYVADATVGFWEALLSDCNGQSFNIGNDQEQTSIRDLAKLVSILDNPELSVTCQRSTADHLKEAPARACPDITKARELLNYDPQVSLWDGLQKTLAWHISRLK